jgi:hypothetical protein
VVVDGVVVDGVVVDGVVVDGVVVDGVVVDGVVVDGGPRFPMLRQQVARSDTRPNRCLADYVAPAGDHLGAFAVAVQGAAELARRYEPLQPATV